MERRSDKFNNIVRGSVPISRRSVSQNEPPRVTQRIPIINKSQQQAPGAPVPEKKASGCGCSRKKPS